MLTGKRQFQRMKSSSMCSSLSIVGAVCIRKPFPFATICIQFSCKMYARDLKGAAHQQQYSHSVCSLVFSFIASIFRVILRLLSDFDRSLDILEFMKTKAKTSNRIVLWLGLRFRIVTKLFLIQHSIIGWTHTHRLKNASLYRK